MDAARAVAITEFPSQLTTDHFKKFYEKFPDEIDVLPNTATATAAVAELAQGKILRGSQQFYSSIQYTFRMYLHMPSLFVTTEFHLNLLTYLVLKDLLQKGLFVKNYVVCWLSFFQLFLLS